jgi:diguanylate cyclase (GGDEF)-like protein
VDHTKVSRLPLSVLLIDVDHFKQINDTHGHLVGDSILKEVATKMRSRLRSSDFMARFGGDEFIVLLPATPALEAAEAAEQLRDIIVKAPLSEDRLQVSLSIGIACHPTHGTTPRELVAAADRALYRSKAAGRNRVTLAAG